VAHAGEFRRRRPQADIGATRGASPRYGALAGAGGIRRTPVPNSRSEAEGDHVGMRPNL
jgi:hypothetical protein